MFNLEKQITEWRQRMLAAGIKAPIPLDELESHLREDVNQQICDGASARQAFETAVQRLGQANRLKVEFERAGQSIEAKRRKFMRVYCIVFPIFFLLFSNGMLLKLEMSLAERLLGLITTALSAVFIASSPLLYRFLPAIQNQRARQTIQIVSILVCVLFPVAFMNLVLPQLNLTLSQIAIVTLWMITPLTAIGSIAYGLEEAAKRHAATSDSLAD